MKNVIGYFTMVVLISVSNLTSAGLDVCGRAEYQSKLTLRFSNVDDASVDSSLFDSQDRTESSFQVQNDWHVLGQPTFIGYGHRYRGFDFKESTDIRFLTNGDVHKLGPYWFTQKLLDSGQWQVAFSPVLTISSNQLKDPGLIHGRGLNIQARIERIFPLDGDSSWSVGICKDNRLSSTDLYPIAAIRGRLSNKARFTIGFPVTEMIWPLSARSRLSWQLLRDGDQWDVYDQERAVYSDFSFSAWVTNLRFSYATMQHFIASVDVSHEFQRQWRFHLTDGTRPRIEGGSSNAVSVIFSYLW